MSNLDSEKRGGDCSRGHTLTQGEGFLLSRQLIPGKKGIEIEFWLHTNSGAVRIKTPAQKEVFFILTASEVDAVSHLKCAQISHESRALDLNTFHKEPVTALYFNHSSKAYRAKNALDRVGIVCFEADIRLTDRYLMERHIYGSVSYVGEQEVGFTSHRALANTRCHPSQFTPHFNVLSLDIECSESGELYSIGLAGEHYRRVIMIGDAQLDSPGWIDWVDDERALLTVFVATLCDVDPDIIIGWNVINFDFRLLVKRAKLYRLSLNVGRRMAEEPSEKAALQWRDSKTEHNQGFITIPGRVVIDGIDALKSAAYQFESFSLESVSRQLLGKGKLSDDIDDRMPEITHDFHHNKTKLAEYNLQDCILVLEIFEHTQLLQYLALRSQLTGLELNRSGGSVAAFVNVYLPKLHRAGYIAPNRPEDGGLASPGGYVMDSRPGLYDHVLVLDFKSLYPSIIRTFLIDPLGLVEGLAQPDDAVPGFKGAFFSRDKHFLPDIIEQLWSARDAAKKSQDDARSQAIKILMNSFYGVLGSGGCPFYDTRLASSITIRGHEIMQTTSAWIEAEGYQVIYGDTDSTFVWLDGEYDYSTASEVGKYLQKTINKKWKEKLRNDFDLECTLELEFETYFRRFLMPTIRGSSLGSKKRYSGVKETVDGSELIFKGLETVRSDWTPLAKTFQTTLYAMVFAGEDVETYVRTVIDETLSGQNDDLLVYRKRLRRRLDLYVKNVPPHVRAARLADDINRTNGSTLRYQNKGWVSYVITHAGPQVIEHRTARLDYEHYVEKQIQPVAEAILPFVGLSFDAIANAQLGLF